MIYILLPAYNEAKNIEAVVSGISGVLLDKEYCIVIVNDGSTDNTQDVISGLCRGVPELKSINFPENRGVGEVFKQGIKYVSELALKNQDILISLDCDRSHPANAINGVIEALEAGNDIVVASRYHPQSKTQGLPFVRELMSNTINFWLKVFFPLKGVKDYTTFFRGYRVGLLLKAQEHYRESFIAEKGFSCMAEILIKLRRFRPKATEVPLVLRFDLRTGRSKMKVLETIAGYLRLILDYFLFSRKR
ncbi:MAG: glycosyltransferase [PVC group bacterium]|nr:glycosyltransferase [PVC group bacterium]